MELEKLQAESEKFWAEIDKLENQLETTTDLKVRATIFAVIEILYAEQEKLLTKALEELIEGVGELAIQKEKLIERLVEDSHEGEP